ncbi:hypothetical protein [Bosea thiooxidans]
MGIVTKALARLFGRHHQDDDVASRETAKILIREGDRVLTGRELYLEIAEKNAAEAAADLKAWYKRLDANNPW